MEHFYQEIEGHFWYLPAYRALFDALPNDEPSVWVEVGVFQGQSLCWLGVEAINAAKPIQIHAVDDFRGWAGVEQGEYLQRLFLRNVEPIWHHTHRTIRDDVSFEIHDLDSVDASTMFSPASCDVVWLDADHSYAAVKADIAAWWPKVRPGGALGGDDWAWSDGGVKQAVEEAFPKERIHLINGEREGQIWPSWIVRKPITPNAG